MTTETRKCYKIRLTPLEAGIVLEVVNDIHEDNTAGLRGELGWRAEGGERDQLKEENAALRRVRDALKRQTPEGA